MKDVTRRKVEADEVRKLLFGDFNVIERLAFDQFLRLSTHMWGLWVKTNLVCIWGVTPPTLMSDEAHIWLYTTEHLEGHEFIFIRQSQIALTEALEHYPILIGYMAHDKAYSTKWLTWLGAKFGPRQTNFTPYIIEAKRG